MLDVDETILDNSYIQEQMGSPAACSILSAGTNGCGMAPRLLPEAREFIDHVAALRGRILFVTNRTLRQCPEAEAFLKAQNISYERVMCGTSNQADKNPRFDQIISESDGYAPINVLAWIGDNIIDFPS